MGERYVIKDRKVVDTELNKTIYFIDNYVDKPVIDILNQQDKRIKELEETLEKARQREVIIHQNYRQGYAKDLEEMNNLREENKQLKQQLHDLPKQIVEEITNELSNNTSLYFEIRESTSAHCPNKEYEWFNYVRFRNYINTILKKYGGEDE